MAKTLRWMDLEAVENLLARQKVSQWIEKSSRSYRERFQKARWIEIALTSVEKRRKRGSIDVNLSRICREVVEFKENEFFKEKKHRDECIKQATQT